MDEVLNESSERPQPTIDPRMAVYKQFMERRMAFFEYVQERGSAISPAGAFKLGRELGVLNSADQYKRHQGSKEQARRIAQRNRRFEG